jgi:BirA family transcriptional regulator, biotin operon repressor / biotin---[acetyl-CoA-carboxylase] ligase
MHINRYHFPVLSSTQVFARHYMHCLRPGYSSDRWFLFSADTQTQGEGTQKRPWYSPPGNLGVTFAFCISKTHKEALSAISRVSVVALAEAMAALGIQSTIKWVNDLMINQKKVAGILCESFSSPAFPGYYVILVGIGLNINLSQAECSKIDQPVTSLLLELGKAINKDELLSKITQHLHAHMQRLLR